MLFAVGASLSCRALMGFEISLILRLSRLVEVA